MDALKKIHPAWFAVAVLVVIVLVLLFQQRRSGYTPTAGTPITLMDLQEFSGFTAEQKTEYSNLLMTSDVLKQAIESRTVEELTRAISSLMNQALMDRTPPPPPPPPAPSSQDCRPGTYSPMTGKEPCIACPANTFCPDSGMTTPNNCPPGYKSMMDSTVCTPMN